MFNISANSSIQIIKTPNSVRCIHVNSVKISMVKFHLNSINFAMDDNKKLLHSFFGNKKKLSINSSHEAATRTQKTLMKKNF